MFIDQLHREFNSTADVVEHLVVHLDALKLLETAIGLSDSKKPKEPNSTTANNAEQRASKRFRSPPDLSRGPCTIKQATAVQEPVGSRLFALIIGINIYKDVNINNLYGAVADSENMSKFLRTHPAPFRPVLEDRIVMLRNQEATRERILSELNKLAENPSIARDDPILIFYAGHGSIASVPDTWEATGCDLQEKIQLIVPHDFVMDRSDSKGMNGLGIHDFEVSWILSRIAINKSDNITVILDCCYSGSGTRDKQYPDDVLVRSVELPENYCIPDDVFQSEDGSRGILPGLRHLPDGLCSHILLAGSRKDEKTHEMPSFSKTHYGLFTHNLLQLFEKHGISNLTYKEAILRMPDIASITGRKLEQHPQCEGKNKNRILFTLRTVDHHLYHVRSFESSSGLADANDTNGTHFFPQCIIRAGDADGITTGAEFEVYADRDLKTSLGTVVAETLFPFETICTATNSTFELPPEAQDICAILVRAGANRLVSVFIDKEIDFLPLIVDIAKKISSRELTLRYLRMVGSLDEKPDIQVNLNDDIVKIEVRDEIYRKSHFPLPVNDIKPTESERILRILHCASKFYWNLHHISQDQRSFALSRGVTVDVVRLKLLSRIKQTWQVSEQIKLDKQDGCLYINVDEKDPDLRWLALDQRLRYGFKITNNFAIPLYVALFYFDVSTLRINQLTLSNTARGRDVDGSIQPSSYLTVGYGYGGITPYVFNINGDQEVDNSFIKLYISTEYVDYSSIEQESPFAAMEHRMSRVVEARQPVLWSTKTIPILQMRKSAFNTYRISRSNT